jgi:hypothetical protein
MAAAWAVPSECLDVSASFAVTSAEIRDLNFKGSEALDLGGIMMSR